MPQHQLAYPVPVPAPRYFSTGQNGTSSAFSSSANPDEDWTKISDLAERRRIQNRIAQRNYRKKLKRRLEDLGRRANDESPEHGKEPSTNSAKATRQQATSTKTARTRIQSPPALTYAKPEYQHDEYLSIPIHDVRDGSHTPPMYPSYAPYSPPNDASMLPYGHMQPYMPVTTLEPCPEYLPVTASAILPPMVSRMTDDGKGIFYAQDDPFAAGLNYGFVPGIHLDASHHHYDNPGSHTPPLSQSYDHSANCSEAGYDYPTTPLSLPGSPPTNPHQ